LDDRIKIIFDEEFLHPLKKQKIKYPESQQLIATGFSKWPSIASVLIPFGTRYEVFWRRVAELCGFMSMHQTHDKILLEGRKNRTQLDMLLQQINFELSGVYLYKEFKANLDTDTEKTKTSDQKVLDVIDHLSKELNAPVQGCYFMPIHRSVSSKIKAKHPELTIQTVPDMIEEIGCTLFTVDDYFELFQTLNIEMERLMFPTDYVREKDFLRRIQLMGFTNIEELKQELTIYETNN
jgi:hypothetical protein